MGEILAGGGWSEIPANDSLSDPEVLSFSDPTVSQFWIQHYVLGHHQLFTPSADGGVNDPLSYIPHPYQGHLRRWTKIWSPPLALIRGGCGCRSGVTLSLFVRVGQIVDVVGRAMWSINHLHSSTRVVSSLELEGRVCQRSRFKVGLLILQWSEGRRWRLVGIFFGFSFCKERCNRSSVQFCNLSFLMMKEVLLFWNAPLYCRTSNVCL